MPRDTQQLLDAPPDLATPSLAGLAWLLRHKEAWPEGFVWDYGDCGYCAIGMAMVLWNGPFEEDYTLYEGAAWIGNALRVSNDFSHKVFLGLSFALCLDPEEISPEHVADAIDAYLATEPSDAP